jgi:hypothetical protein
VYVRKHAPTTDRRLARRGEPTVTHAEMAAQLLRGAANFFRSMKAVNRAIEGELEANAQACETMADRVETDPTGEAPPLQDDGDRQH